MEPGDNIFVRSGVPHAGPGYHAAISERINPSTSNAGEGFQPLYRKVLFFTIRIEGSRTADAYDHEIQVTDFNCRAFVASVLISEARGQPGQDLATKMKEYAAVVLVRAIFSVCALSSKKQTPWWCYKESDEPLYELVDRFVKGSMTPATMEQRVVKYIDDKMTA
jgi:hypothetical protein